MTRWFSDNALVSALPLRYRAYARWSRLVASPSSRRVAGGSFLLRAIKRASRAARLPTAVRIHGIDGLVVVTDFADERVLEVIHEIRGENPEYQVMRRLLSPGDTFIDVGANFGTFSLLASRLVGESGRVIAIEPQPSLAQGIGESARLSGASNVSVLRCACGASDGGATVFVPRDDAGRAGLFPAFSARPGYTVVETRIDTLDDIAARAQLTGRIVVKIDVEGSEMDVIAGASHLIAAYHPALIVEQNPWSAEAAGFRENELMDRLRSLGYESISTVEGFLGGTESPPRGQANLVAIHSAEAKTLSR